MNKKRRSKHGRKSGSTKKNNHTKESKEKDLKYKIVCRYIYATTYHNPNVTNLFKKDIFDNIVADEVVKNEMPPTFSFPYATCLSRIRRLSYKMSMGIFAP